MSGATYFLVLQYDGSGFAGWQRQLHQRTVQAELEDALEKLAGQRVPTMAAGRTDSGVHALGQVVSIRMPTVWDARTLLKALRAHTPPDLWVARAGAAPARFHARKHALSRRYRYVIGWDPASRSPFRRPYEWSITRAVSLATLNAAAERFAGTHDFRSYSAVGQSKPHYRCAVSTSVWHARGQADGCIFTVEADRFLHRMVRFMVGMMLDVAMEKRPLGDVDRVLQLLDNREASPPAPAHGLYLVGARYPQLDEGYDR
ncbi:MAG TPA: tRNA pseudouridine(38-40) synthase TruA [Gemmatimonadales bacterium]